MYWRLWDQTIWQWDTNYSTDEGSAAKQEKVPVETSRLSQRVLPTLGAETAYVLHAMISKALPQKKYRTYVIVVKEQSKEDANWEGNKHPLDRQIPKVYQPATIYCRVKSTRMIELQHIGLLKGTTDVHKAGPEKCAYL